MIRLLAQNDSPLAASGLWLPSGAELSWLAPELALVATIVAVLVWPLIARRNSYHSAFITLAGTVLTTILVSRLSVAGTDAGLTPLDADGSPMPMFVIDPLSLFFKLFLMLFLVLVTALWMLGSAEREKDAPEFFVLLLSRSNGKCGLRDIRKKTWPAIGMK